jgi:hypothetical protein
MTFRFSRIGADLWFDPVALADTRIIEHVPDVHGEEHSTELVLEIDAFNDALNVVAFNHHDDPTTQVLGKRTGLTIHESVGVPPDESLSEDVDVLDAPTATDVQRIPPTDLTPLKMMVVLIFRHERLYLRSARRRHSW